MVTSQKMFLCQLHQIDVSISSNNGRLIYRKDRHRHQILMEF